MDENSHAAGAVTQRFVKGLEIGVLAIVASLGLAGRAHATYLHSDHVPAYLDRGWYYLLDEGQYYYLDRGQYNLLGGLGYSFGRPCYQIQLEGGIGQVVATPEPSTIGFLGLGALGVLVLRNKRRD